MRIKAGIKQKDLAKEWEVTIPMISSWERGSSNPNGANTRKIIARFGEKALESEE